MNEVFKEIAFSIIEQAIDDYKRLKRLDIDCLVIDKERPISKREIENFFHSEWCDFLLSTIDLTGEDILRYLNRE